MFNKGDLIIYSTHGLCHIDDITEKTISDVTKKYYELHPLNNANLKISTPVDNRSISMLEIMSKKQADIILKSFRKPGIDWIEKSHQRNQFYSDVAKNGSRLEKAKIVNTLMRKKQEIEMNGKKFSEYDRKLLTIIQSILFNELAFSLETTVDEIHTKVDNYLQIDEVSLVGEH